MTNSRRDCRAHQKGPIREVLAYVIYKSGRFEYRDAKGLYHNPTGPAVGYLRLEGMNHSLHQRKKEYYLHGNKMTLAEFLKETEMKVTLTKAQIEELLGFSVNILS